MGKRTAAGILLIHHRPIGAPDVPAVRDHIDAFAQYSRFPVVAINTELGFPRWLSHTEFQSIVLHFSLFGGSRYRLSRPYLDYIDSCPSGYKVAFFQDEYQFCKRRFDFVKDHGVDCIYTLLEEEWIPAVYGQNTRVEAVVPTLAGYVGERLIGAAREYGQPDAGRAIDVGYRGRELMPFMGRAARDKTAIAEGFLKRAQATGLALDVETKEHERLYGKRWYKFLGECRCVLGVEAGVSAFDLEGVVYAEYETLRSAFPDAGFDEMVERLAPVLAAWEDRIYYRTISPRHFEGAAFRNCQILFEGRYSGILEPMRHYIPLKRDFSNFAEVIGLLKDTSLRARLTETTHQDIVASGKYSYRHFINRFDRSLEAHGLAPRRAVGFANRHVQALARIRPEAPIRRIVSLVYYSLGRKTYRWLAQAHVAVWPRLAVRIARRLRTWRARKLT